MERFDWNSLLPNTNLRVDCTEEVDKVWTDFIEREGHHNPYEIETLIDKYRNAFKKVECSLSSKMAQAMYEMQKKVYYRPNDVETILNVIRKAGSNNE